MPTIGIGDVIASLIGAGTAVAGGSVASGAAKRSDTQLVEQLNRSLTLVLDRARYTLGEAIPSNSPSYQFYVPADWQVCISAAEAQQLITAVQQANAQTIAAYVRAESRQNFTHTTWVPFIVGYLQRIAAGQGTCTGIQNVQSAIAANVSGTTQAIATSLGVAPSTVYLGLAILAGLLGLFLLLSVLRR